MAIGRDRCKQTGHLVEFGFRKSVRSSQASLAERAASIFPDKGVLVDFTTIIVNFVDILFRVLTYAIIIRALMSWFPIAPTNPIVRLLDDVTEPILAPLRRIVPRLGMMDITPIVALVLLQVLDQVLISGLRGV